MVAGQGIGCVSPWRGWLGPDWDPPSPLSSQHKGLQGPPTRLGSANSRTAAATTELQISTFAILLNCQQRPPHLQQGQARGCSGMEINSFWMEVRLPVLFIPITTTKTVKLAVFDLYTHKYIKFYICAYINLYV